jgi:hypothetical protein
MPNVIMLSVVVPTGMLKGHSKFQVFFVSFGLVRNDTLTILIMMLLMTTLLSKTILITFIMGDISYN